jgi:hypothetical protein
VRITHERCPACEDRGALTTDGRPVIIGGGQLRGATSYVGLTKASAGCEVCKGSGWVEPEDTRDPYSKALQPSEALKRRVTLRQT